MAATESDVKIFSCSSCDFVVDYHYRGRKPPFAKNIMLLEDCYIMKDPFSTSGGFVSIGGTCSLCGCNVCMSTDCSLFYTRRFCLKCAGKNMKEFPPELQQGYKTDKRLLGKGLIGKANPHAKFRPAQRSNVYGLRFSSKQASAQKNVEC